MYRIFEYLINNRRNKLIISLNPRLILPSFSDIRVYDRSQTLAAQRLRSVQIAEQLTVYAAHGLSVQEVRAPALAVAVLHLEIPLADLRPVSRAVLYDAVRSGVHVTVQPVPHEVVPSVLEGAEAPEVRRSLVVYHGELAAFDAIRALDSDEGSRLLAYGASCAFYRMPEGLEEGGIDLLSDPSIPVSRRLQNQVVLEVEALVAFSADDQVPSYAADGLPDEIQFRIVPADERPRLAEDGFEFSLGFSYLSLFCVDIVFQHPSPLGKLLYRPGGLKHIDSWNSSLSCKKCPHLRIDLITRGSSEVYLEHRSFYISC